MAYSFATTISGGATANVVVPFPYITTANVHVALEGVQVTDALLTWASPGVVVLPSVPTAGTSIRVYRETKRSGLDTQFSTPAVFDPRDLNRLTTQLLYVTQEAFDMGEANALELDAVTGYVNEAVAAVGEAAEDAEASALEASGSASSASATASGIVGSVADMVLLAEQARDAAVAAKDAAVAAAGSMDTEAVLLKTGNLTGLADVATARTNLGLGNVDNTSDANKPVSTATAEALGLKAAASHTHAYADIGDKPTLGTASTMASTAFMAAGSAQPIPTTVWDFKVGTLLYVATQSSVVHGATIAGSSLRMVRCATSDEVAGIGISPNPDASIPGTWRNISGIDLPAYRTGYFVRTA